MERIFQKELGFMTLIFLLLLPLQVFSSTCATDIKSFRALLADEDYPLLWEETTADDGKPLIVKISELGGKLHLEFDKTKEGPWAQGTADICKDEDIVASISKEQIKLGKAAHWAIKMSMKGGAKFKLQKLKPLVLKISTFGWSGEFIPRKAP